MKFCTLICPCRSEPQKLFRLLRSFFLNANHPLSHKAIIRVDSDWLPILGQADEICSAFPDVELIVGDRQLGYKSVPMFLAQCARLANSSWLWPMDDDYEIVGRGWDDELMQASNASAPAAQPQTYLLNESTYTHNGEGYGPQGMIIHHELFPQVLIDQSGDWDKSAFNFIKSIGQTIHPLNGISLRHHWDESLSVKRRNEQLCTPPSPSLT